MYSSYSEGGSRKLRIGKQCTVFQIWKTTGPGENRSCPDSSLSGYVAFPTPLLAVFQSHVFQWRWL